LIIKNMEIKKQVDIVEVSATVDGFRLWYRLPDTHPASKAGDTFLAAALLPAMLQGEKLEIDPSMPVSPMLLSNISTLQEIHHCWNPMLKIVPIQATTLPAEPLNHGAFSFFSGGVDSMFTFLKRLQEISYVVFIHGFDFYRATETYQPAVARNNEFVEGFGKTLIPLETNQYHFGYRYNLSRVLTQGSALASVALLLGFQRAFVPSSDCYSYLNPLGTHPLTDPLYSNESVSIIHDGAELRRIDKTIKLTESPSVLEYLRVCVNDMNVNCGKCVKCLRTMIPLYLLRTNIVPFPPFPPLETLKHMNWQKEPVFLKENLDLAIEKGDKELSDILSACHKKNERLKLFKEIDRLCFGGIIRRAYRRVKNDPPMVRRIETTPPRD